MPRTTIRSEDISSGSISLSGGNLAVDSSGRVTMPNQVCFTATNIAGSLTTVTAGNPYPFNTVTTNVGNHFNASNYRFTAPVDGNYFLQCFILVHSSNNVADMRLHVNGSNTGIAGYGDGAFNGGWMKGVSCAILSLNANDYVYFTSLNTQSFHNGSSTSEHSQFIGYLIG